MSESENENEREERQAQILAWTRKAFGDAQATSLPQRGLRLLEEAAEAYQATGGDLAVARKLVDYVFARPVGELHQEIGGVSVCVLALAAAAGLSANAEERREVARVLAKPIEEMRARNAAKNAAGFLVTGETPPPVLDQTTMRAAGEAEVDANPAVPMPAPSAPEVLRPGSTWTGPDGTTYDVVRAEDVGDRPRWWFLNGIRSDEIGLRHPDDLNDAAPGGAWMLLALVLRDRREPLDAGAWARSEVVTGAGRERDALAAEVEQLRARVRVLEEHCEKANDERQALDELYDETLVKRDELAREADRLRVRVSGLESEAAGWVASYDKLGEAIEVHLPEHAGDLVARIANAGAVLAGARASRDAYQQEARTAERRLTEERSARIEVVQRLERTEATLKRWQARARKAEARVTVLTEERDGLTLRLGQQVRREVVKAGGKIKTVLEIGKRAGGSANHGFKLIEPATGRRAPARTRKGGR